MGLYLPFLSTDRRQKPDDALVATIALQGQVLRVAHVNRRAGEAGVRPGQTLAEAKSVALDLVTCDDDPAADLRQLETLAVWAGRFSPTVHIEGENSLMVDVTGSERLFAGERNLLRQALEGLNAEGFFARGAIADTVGAAWAVTHAHPDIFVIVPPGQTAAELTALPVWSLRIDSGAVKALALVGVKTIAVLLHLPRSSLAPRFGEGVLRRLDQALGDIPEVLTPYRPCPALTSRFHLGAATTRLDVLIEAVRRALEWFCEQLAQRVAGVRRMYLTFYCFEEAADRGSRRYPITLELNMSEPSRSVDHLFPLLTVLLDKTDLPAPANALMLWAREVESLDGRQEELFDTSVNDARELSGLLDRLAVRLGREAVVRPRLLGEHQPERAFRYESLVGGQETSRGLSGWESSGSIRTKAAAQPGGGLPEEEFLPPGPRPLRLVAQPLEISATAVTPDGPPAAFQWRGQAHVLVNSVGPERIETGWWRGRYVQRDYYRVTTESGRRCWIFRRRDTKQWFLHGWFD